MLILDEVRNSVVAQLNDQAKLGVQVENQGTVPETGPAYRGLWWRIPNVTAVFADLKGSTALNSSASSEVAATAYTYFIRAMTVVLERFSAGYIDIQGDGIFGLFGGKGSMFHAAACGITMRTLMETEVEQKFKKDARSEWDLKVGIGIDRGTLLVRQLGLKGAKLNEVWAGMPVNAAAKLSSVAGPNQVAVSDRAFAGYERASKPRQQALIRSCAYGGVNRGRRLSAPAEQTPSLWVKHAAPKNLGLDFGSVHTRKSGWCRRHGAEICETILTGRVPGG